MIKKSGKYNRDKSRRQPKQQTASKRTANRKMSASVAPTMAILAKEAMMNIPEHLNTKKEIEEYFKIAIKEIVMKKKEEEKAAKPKVAKPKKDKVIDSNEDEPKAIPVKVAKPPTKRKIFYDEMHIKIKDLFPGLNPQKTKKKIDELWKIHMDELYGSR